MYISIRVHVMPLWDSGQYRPEFELIEVYGDRISVTQYFISELFSTEEEAGKRAKQHAVAEAKKTYGNDVPITFAESGGEKNL